MVDVSLTTGSSAAAPSKEFFRELELERTRALVERDMATIEHLHAPEYQLITPSGNVFTRERYLAALAARPFYAAWTVGSIEARLAPSTALIRYQATLRFPSGRVIVCWHTDSYEKRGERWQAVWSQATEIVPPPDTPSREQGSGAAESASN